MHYRYRIWAIKVRGSEKILLAGLGYKKHAVKRWQEIGKSGEKNMPILLWQFMKKNQLNPLYTVCFEHGKYERRVDARDELLKLRMQLPHAIIEDWLP